MLLPVPLDLLMEFDERLHVQGLYNNRCPLCSRLYNKNGYPALHYGHATYLNESIPDGWKTENRHMVSLDRKVRIPRRDSVWVIRCRECDFKAYRCTMFPSRPILLDEYRLRRLLAGADIYDLIKPLKKETE